MANRTRVCEANLLLSRFNFLEHWQKNHQPISIQVTPALKREARQEVAKALGYERASVMTDAEVVQRYVAGFEQ